MLGIAEAMAGNALRARIRRRPGARPVQPLVAARAVLVAKASALAGAIMAGAWAGLLVYVLPRSGEVTAAAADAVSGGSGWAARWGWWPGRCGWSGAAGPRTTTGPTSRTAPSERRHPVGAAP